MKLDDRTARHVKRSLYIRCLLITPTYCINMAIHGPRILRNEFDPGMRGLGTGSSQYFDSRGKMLRQFTSTKQWQTVSQSRGLTYRPAMQAGPSPPEGHRSLLTLRWPLRLGWVTRPLLPAAAGASLTSVLDTRSAALI